MRIIDAKDYPNIPRRVVTVVLNETDPETIHADGSPHVAPPATPEQRARADSIRAEFGREAKAWEWCQDCTFNWRIEEFTFSREDLQVNLNKWGNPVHDGQEVVSARDKTWDELYTEVDERLGSHADFGAAVREAPPALVDETELDFESIASGEPYMEDGMARQRFGVLRRGVLKAHFIAEGADRSTFAGDKDAKFARAQDEILAIEQQQAAARAIVSA